MRDDADRQSNLGPTGTPDPFELLMAQIAAAPRVPLGSVLQAGTEVGGFRVCERIGRGAFCSVYRATHPLIGKEVAIKLLARAHAQDPCSVQRFIEEARAVTRLRHPNIVDIYGFGELHDGTPYHVMELLRGNSLAEVLRQHRVLPIGRALHILGEVASALDAAHAAGILHRDLKPPNVFILGDISGDFEVKLLDFGVAKFLDGTTQTTAAGMVIGTPAYMSPEQCAAEPLAATSDVYSLGVLAFELLTGQLPFSNENNARALVQHLTEMPLRVSEVAQHLPRGLDAAVAAMLDKAPAKRPQSAGEAVERLRQAVSTGAEGGPSPTLSPLGPAGGSRSRRWAVTALLVGLSVATATWMVRSPAHPLSEASRVEATPTEIIPAEVMSRNLVQPVVKQPVGELMSADTSFPAGPVPTAGGLDGPSPIAKAPIESPARISGAARSTNPRPSVRSDAERPKAKKLARERPTQRRRGDLEF